MSDFLVVRPFFVEGVKYYPGEIIAIDDPVRSDALLEGGVIKEMPGSVKSEPPVTSTTIETGLGTSTEGS